MSIDVTDAPESWYHIANIMETDGIFKAACEADREEMHVDDFTRIAEQVARSQYFRAVVRRRSKSK